MLASGSEPGAQEFKPMSQAILFDYTLAGLVSAGLLFYLVYALLRPEGGSDPQPHPPVACLPVHPPQGTSQR
jgi:K+-transporting ATPase KdpF subunit